MEVRARAWIAIGVALVSGPGCAAQDPGLAFAPAPGSPIAAGPRPGGPVVADFNADGRPDLALPCGERERPDTWRILVLLNDGTARFTVVGRDRPLASYVDTIAAADFNGDSLVDAAGVEHDSYSVHLFLGDGGGGLISAPASPLAAHTGTRPHTHAVAALDVNGDAHADILTTNADDDAISVLLGDGVGGFTPAPGSPFAAERHPYSTLTIRDLNEDGKADVVAPLLMSRGLGVYLGDGSGRFSPAPGSPHRVGERPGFAHVDDVNQDGRPDILATHDDVGMLDVLLNEGGGRFSPAPGSPVRLPRSAWSLATADFDRDGRTDVLLSPQGRGGLTLLLGDGRAGFREARVAMPAGDEPNDVFAVDLNADGKPDIVTSNYASGDVTVLLAR